MDDAIKTKAAENIRKLLLGRIARLLGCEPSDLSAMRIGTMVHFLFLLIGDSEVMPGFNTAVTALRDLLGHELLWALEKPEVVETPKGTVN